MPVLLGGDERAMYGQVYQILPGLQAGRRDQVSLMSQPGNGKQTDANSQAARPTMETFGEKARAYLYALLVHLAVFASLFVGLLWTHECTPGQRCRVR